MTMQVPVWYKDQWDTKVIQRFQAEGFLLKGMTEPPFKIDGLNFHWLRTQKVDVGGAYVRGSALTPLNPNDDQIIGSSQEWDALFRIYDFDVTRMTPNEQDVRQIQATRALGRKADRIINDALMAATIPGGQIISAPLSAITPYACMAPIAGLFDRDVPDDGEIYCGLPAVCWEQMKAFRIFANADYVGPDDLPFVRRTERRTWNGVQWFRLPNHLYNYLTVSTTNDTWRFRMWHKSALGTGHNLDMRTEWQRKMEEGKYWAINHTIDGCCVALQTEGIFEFQVTVSQNVAPEEFVTTTTVPANY